MQPTELQKTGGGPTPPIEFTVNELQTLRLMIITKLANAKQYPTANRNLIPLLESLSKKLGVQ